VAFAGSGRASDLFVTDFVTGELTTEMAGFTWAAAVTAKATLRIAAARIEFFIFLPIGSNHRFLADLGHRVRRNHVPLTVNSEKTRFL
jgi:hypothetical protein